MWRLPKIASGYGWFTFTTTRLPMPSRGPSIDPSLPLGKQTIGTTVQMPIAWLQIFHDAANKGMMSRSRLMCLALAEYAEKHGIDLPPYK